jgi:uncharacterized repeat protein (TIGR01451 family)
MPGKTKSGAMKLKILFIPLVTFCCLQAGYSQVIRPFAHRYYNSSVRGNVVYVSNSIISSGGVGTGNPGTGEPPPGGSTRNNGNTAININIDKVTFIPYGSSWKYWANTMANYQANWQTVAYNDAAWPAGNGELGYGDGDEATCIPSGGGGTLCLPSGNKYGSYYFRQVVNIPNPALYTSYTFNVERDDGYVLYINGVEYSRNNMPAGAVAYNTPASAAIEDAVITFTVPNTAFVAGNNTIAVEMHQSPINAGTGLSSSSDISFNLELFASPVFNASSADLSLPSCATVLWAGLYWGAGQGTDGTTTGWITGHDSCQLKLPGASNYTTVNATTTDLFNAGISSGLNHTGYMCFADITSLVNTSSANGTYQVANVVGPTGIVNGYGGWTIVVAYQDPASIIRELNVFDGNVIIDGGQPPVDVGISGFNTPPFGPVTCELGAVVFDGDRTSTDSFAFRQNGAPAFLNLTPNATSNLNDMWNSTISYKGAVVTTRNPAFQNTVGYDADIIDLPNALNANLSNNQTSATIRFSSPSENYIVQVVTATISIKEPYIQLRKTSTDVNGGALTGGDELQYNMMYINNGNDSSINTYIIDTIPFGTTYKPGSILIGGVPKTDAAGDDEAEYDMVNRRVIMRVGAGATSAIGGRVLATGTGTVNFSVYVPDICFIQTCINPISNQATIYYTGATSGDNFFNRSGSIISGCFVETPRTDIITGTCRSAKDTILANICPATTITLPITQYIGYQFYSAMPFIPANIYNSATPVTYSRIIYAYFDGPGSCDDTLQINIFITACPDIDDDNDGIPDYVEMANSLAWGDHDGDGVLNWNDAQYPGYIDNNTDNFNDNFDPSADSDNDGVPNFIDSNFPGYADSNGDGVNDNMDKDLDGIPNHLDLDSDNDGIPDAVESFGVDANGDGRIDNYSDTDNDGFSQNVDANNTGVSNSALGLGPLDTDGDGLPNYLDLDSDNDGIPDVTEVFGTDAVFDGKFDSFTDTDGDGLNDLIDGDVGNDNFAENFINSLLRTSADANSDGRLDSWPFKNMENDSKANPYDLDSDGDGIPDVREAQFTDANFDGQVDGAINANGWNTLIAGGGSLSLPNTDATGQYNLYDIDSDDDGIPDNVEGMATAGYLLPATADTDNDGLDNRYDNIVGFGGNGINPVNIDGDGLPDYLDNDTDGDGLNDIIEGNDLNLNGLPDDNVTLTGLDNDSDGLDNRFDNDNASAEGTSAYMGDGGSTSGDPSPGSITTVQRTFNSFGCGFERDWRCVFYVLNCKIIVFKAHLQNKNANLQWTVYCDRELDNFVVERSFDGMNFNAHHTIDAQPGAGRTLSYYDTDNLQNTSQHVVYYRLKIFDINGKINFSNIIPVKLGLSDNESVEIIPNPVRSDLQILLTVTSSVKADILIYDSKGTIVDRHRENLQPGTLTLNYSSTAQLPNGNYYLHIQTGERILRKKFSILRY